MKKYLVILLSLSCLELKAQNPNFEWAFQFESTTSQSSVEIEIDQANNVYLLGYFYGTVDFDPGSGVYNLTAAGSNRDIFINKFDSSGNLIWAKKFGANGYDFGTSLELDTNGTLYITGTFAFTVDFNPSAVVYNLTSAGAQDGFILKLDSAGNFIWVQSISGTAGEVPDEISLDTMGNIYVSGTFSGTSDFDPGVVVYNLTTAGLNDVFIAKYDNSGNFIWAKMVGGSNNEYVYCLKVDNYGNSYFSGSYEGIADFDPDTSNYNLYPLGARDIFVSKLNASGNFVWAKNISGAGFEATWDLDFDSNGNLFFSGYFEQSVDFDPGSGNNILTSTGGQDIFVLSLDTAGNFRWAKNFGGLGDEQGYTIYVDNSDMLYTSGFFIDTADLDPGIGTYNVISTGQDDIYINKLNSSGDFVWGISTGGGYQDRANSVFVTDNGEIFTAGWFVSLSDLDPGQNVFNVSSTSPGVINAFVLMLSQCANGSVDIVVACDSFLWIDGNTYTSSNNSATHTLTNAVGCDSLVTLNLTLMNSISSVDIVTSCDSYTWIDGNTYSASTNTPTHTIVGGAANGCDSTVTLNLIINSVSDITTLTSGITISANNTNANYQWLDCDNGYIIISGETNQSFTPTSNGNYALQLTENGCIDTSSCVNITSVNIIENSFSDEFVVYPNPTNSKVSIQFEKAHLTLEITIYSINGQVIDSVTFQNSSYVNFSIDAPDGIYLLKITNERFQQAMIRFVTE